MPRFDDTAIAEAQRLKEMYPRPQTYYEAAGYERQALKETTELYLQKLNDRIRELEAELVREALKNDRNQRQLAGLFLRLEKTIDAEKRAVEGAQAQTGNECREADTGC